MREIKFRAKVADEPNEWVYGYLTSDNTIYQSKETKYSKYCGTGTFIIDTSTLGQYTNLKDKNGKEIYEGDILKIENIDYAKVYYDEDRMAWGLWEIGEWYLDSPLLSDNSGLDLLVAGNIYENKDLLEV